MPTIKVTEPSPGKVTPVFAQVTTSWTTLVEAPLFSKVDPSNRFLNRDPGDPDRALLPGLVFFDTPIRVFNHTGAPGSSDGNSAWLKVRVLDHTGAAFELATVFVPPQETAFASLQALSLIRMPTWSNGQRLQVSATHNNRLTLAWSYTLSVLADHFISDTDL
jgi:hypothetical protein